MYFMHSSYSPGRLVDISFSDGSSTTLGSVREGGWKDLSYNFSAKLPDGTFVAFEPAEVAAVSHVIDGSVRSPIARLEVLAAAVSSIFPSRDAFFAALVGVAFKMVNQPT